MAPWAPLSTDEEGFLTELPELPEEEFCIYGTVYSYPDKADALYAAYQEFTRHAASEPGTSMYCLSRDTSDPTIFYFFERYKGRKAFEAHVSTPTQQKVQADGLIRGVKAAFAPPILPAPAPAPADAS